MNLSEAKRAIRESNPMTAAMAMAPYTMVRVKAKLGGRDYEAVGLAKCSPDDEWSFQRGCEVAEGRAVAEIAREYVKNPPRSLWGNWSDLFIPAHVSHRCTEVTKD